MRKSLLTALTCIALAGPAVAVEYKAVKDWVRLPDVNGKATNQHGDVAVSSKGEIYVSTLDENAGLQVFSPDGKFLRNVPGAPNDFHGFVIRKDKDGEFIYGPRLTAQTIVKLTLEGKKVLEIPASAIPDQFKSVTPPTRKNAKGEVTPNPDAGKTFVRLTAMDVAPNGDLYVTDGYASDYVHQFDRNGKYLKSFGGKKEPYGFKTLHKIAIDARFTPARIIGVDRANGRVVHLSLDGALLGVIATDLLLPAAVAVQGDYAAIGELKGRVTILDKAGQVVAKFGTNSNADEVGSNKPEPTKWLAGMVTAPHGVAFSAKGDVFVSEYSVFGRVHRFDRQ
ncbi:MAG: hypothetical protein EXS32_10050 [Opitutus sp.]|nr:hypothetical protein [Opitutus sp.]